MSYLKHYLFSDETTISKETLESVNEINNFFPKTSKAFYDCKIIGDIKLNTFGNYNLFNENQNSNVIIQFKNCEFIDCNLFYIQDLKINAVRFIDCKFSKTNIVVNSCFLNSLLYRSDNAKEIKILNSTITDSKFTNKLNQIFIKNSSLSNVTYVDLKCINIVNQDVSFEKVVIDKAKCDFMLFNECKIDNYKFQYSNLKEIYIGNSTKEAVLKIIDINVSRLIIKNNLFEKILIDKLNYEIELNEKTIFNLENCEINETSLISNSNFNLIIFKNNIISKIFTLKNVTTNILELESNIDSKFMNYINLKINFIKKLNLETIISLKLAYDKQGLIEEVNKYTSLEKDYYLKSKIDHNNLLKSLFQNRSKLSIYGLTKLYSNHGTNWGRAILVTLLAALFFYSILFFNQHDYEYYSTLLKNKFWNGYFKFLIVTDYSNPIFTDKNKIYFEKNTILWIPNLLGKISIGFGIYETIKSFRQFHK